MDPYTLSRPRLRHNRNRLLWSVADAPFGFAAVYFTTQEGNEGKSEANVAGI
jgi:hypothetical protein